jgi:hypothetical protein
MKLDQRADESVAYAVGYILKGLSRINPKRLFQTIDNNIEQLSTAQKIAYAIALQGIEYNEEIPSHIVDFIISNSASEHPGLRKTTIYALMTRFNTVTKVRDKLEELCRQRDDDTILFISANSISISRENKELVFRMLKICSNNRKPQVLQNVSSTLAAVAKDFPIKW